MVDWVTADLRLGHDKIITLAPMRRRFTTIEEHDAFIVENWNATVRKKDTVRVLGDLAVRDDRRAEYFAAIAARLNGVIEVVLGNHDRGLPLAYTDRFSRVEGVIVDKKRQLVYTHVPVVLSSFGTHGRGENYVNVHGHLHEDDSPPGRYLNVSLEKTNFTPVSLEWVVEQANQLRG